jgi:hypothetical protein
MTISYARYWGLGGGAYGGEWKPICGCKAVTHETGFATEEECVDDWMNDEDGSCHNGFEVELHYARNYALGGASINGEWHAKCGCQPVDWATEFTTERECVIDWHNAEHGRCQGKGMSTEGLAPRDIYYDRNWMMGGGMINGEWVARCAAKRVSYKTPFHSEWGVIKDWENDDPPCNPSWEYTLSYDRNWALSGQQVGKQWVPNCGCMAVAYSTEWATEDSCVAAWNSDGKDACQMQIFS